MYSGEYDACRVTLSVYPHRASLKNMPGHGGNRTYDLWNTSPMVVGSIPTLARHIFQACPVWIHTQSNTTSIVPYKLLWFVSELPEKFSKAWWCRVESGRVEKTLMQTFASQLSSTLVLVLRRHQRVLCPEINQLNLGSKHFFRTNSC